MNIFNLGRKLEELREDHDDLRQKHGFLVERCNDLEKALVDMQAAHNEDLKEIRERLDMPQRRKPTVRPWNMLRSVAEAGERFMAEKKNA